MGPFVRLVIALILLGLGLAGGLYLGPDRGRQPLAAASEEQDLPTAGVREVAARLSAPSFDERTPLEPGPLEEKPTSAAERHLSVSEQLELLDGILRVLPAHDGTESGFRAKYEGLGPKDLERIYPTLRSIRKEEMFVALDEAIRTGRERSILAPAGEPVDFAREANAGGTVHAYVSRSEPLGGGVVQHRGVCFGPDDFPDVYLRILEETWVHDQMDAAGLCREGQDVH